MSVPEPLTWPTTRRPPPNGAGMVKRGSGLIVPAALERQIDQAIGEVPVATDPDGRRRIVFTKQKQKRIDQLLTELSDEGIGMAMGCRECGMAMVNEGIDTESGARDPDAGYGCKCKRVHFI